jgi:flavin-dependent dehydrogenase
MMPETLAALRAVGLDLDLTEGQKFSGICFVQEGAHVIADFPQGPGIGLRRLLLQEKMIARAEQCGVRLLWRTPVSGIDADGVRISNRRIRARWIVGADGHGSRVRRWSGLDETRRSNQRQAIRRHYHVRPWSNYMEIHWGSHAQAYVTPIGREEVCVVVMSEHAEYASFQRALQELPELRERLAGAEISSRERGAVTSTRSLFNVQRGNVALVGDASGSVDAITGEGLRLSFRQAFALADAMVIGDLRRYQEDHRELTRRPMFMGDLMLMLGRNPRVRERVVRALQSKPDLFARLLATHGGAGKPATFLAAGAMLGWHLLAM